MKRRIFLSGLAISVILLFLSFLSQPAFAQVGEGHIVDNFTLTDFDGNTHNLYDYEGQVIFINFWAVI